MAYEDHQIRVPDDCLFITTGELRGVSVPLDKGDVRIGFSADCDAVLIDDEDSVAEAIVRRTDDPLLYTIEIERGVVSIGGKRAKRSKVLKLPLRTPVSIGSVEMIIAGSAADAERAARASSDRSALKSAWPIAAFCAALVLIAVSGVLGGRASIAAQSTDDGSAKPFNARNGAVMPLLAANALRDRLEAVGLSRLTPVADRNDQMVTVSGKLRPSDADRWLAVQSWFDLTFGDSVQLEARLTGASDSVTLPFSVESVWMDNAPRLTLNDGSRKRPGDMLPGGWKLIAISVDKIKISKNGETLAVPL